MDTAQVRPPLFSNKALVSLTIPIVIDSLFAIMAGMVDSAMVSSAGEAAVSAVSLVDAINLLILTLISAICNGGAVVTAQYVGSRNYKNGCVSANQLLYASTALAVVFTLITLFFHNQILYLVYGNIDESVFQDASIYFFYTLLGYPLYAMGASSTAVLRSMGKTRVATVIVVTCNLVNVAGNALLIFGFHMGAAGAAIATTFCRLVFAAMGLVLASNNKFPVHFEKLLQLRLDKHVMRRVLRIGVANGLESGLFQVGKLLITSLVSSFGTIYIAAYSVASSINNLGWTTISAFSTAILTVVGQCIGAGLPEQAKTYTKKYLKVATVLMFTLFGCIFLLRHQVVQLFDFGQEALDAAAYYTGFSALCAIFSFYSMSFVPMSAFRAAGDVRYATTVAIVTMFAFRVGLCYLLNWLFPSLGLACVFIGMWADWICRSILNIFHYRSDKWLKKCLI